MYKYWLFLLSLIKNDLLNHILVIFIIAVLTSFNVKTEIPDSLRPEYIASLAETDPDRALSLLDESEDRGFALPDEASEVWADAYEAKGEYQSALAYARVALSSQSSRDDIESYRRNCEKVIGLLMRLGDYKEALRYCRVLRLKLDKVDAPESMGASLARLEAVAYREFGQKSLSDSLMAESVRLFSLGSECHCLGGLAENYKLMSVWAEEDKDYSRSLEYSDLWLQELELAGLSSDVSSSRLAKESALANLSVAVAAAEAGLVSKAAAYYEAARLETRGTAQDGDPEYCFLVARYNLLSGDEEYSMNILTRLSASAAIDGRLRIKALRLLAGMAESQKDYHKAFALSERACDLADSLFSAWKLDNALQLSAFYKERELRGEIVGHKVKIRFQRTLILFAFILVTLLSALVAFAMMSNKAIKRKNLVMAKLIEEYRNVKDSVEHSVPVGNSESSPVEETGVEAVAPVSLTAEDRADYIALRDLVRSERLFLEQNLTRDKVAQLSGMGRNRLAKVIQEYSGTNFSGFVNIMRLEYSLALLENSGSTVESVALDSGFSNVRTYQRLFKERFGMTPTEYREASLRLREEVVNEDCQEESRSSD